MTTYRARLQAACDERGALCVGIDPHPALLRAWGLDVTAAGVERFARGLLDAVGEQVAAFKPQSAFFEVHGAAGVAVLERVLADIAAAGAVSVLDGKRGDIGSTMSAYAEAYLADGAPLAADAITVSPFLGFGSLQPAFDLAHHTGRGVYVLARTSNPEGGEVQLATTSGRSVGQRIVDAAKDVNEASGQAAIGLVIGGTHDALDLDLSGFGGSILVPGIGFQGGRIEDLPELFGAAAAGALPAVSRDVLAAGPDPDALRERVANLLGAPGASPSNARP